MKAVFALFFAFLALSPVSSTTPTAGVGLMVSQDTLQVFKEIIPGVIDKVQGAVLPDMTIDGLQVSNLTISKLAVSTDDISYGSPSANQAHFQVGSVQFEMDFDFEYTFLKIFHQKGSIKASSDSAGLETSLTIGSADQKLTLNVDDIALSLDKLDLKIEGNFVDKFLSFFVKLLNGVVKSALTKTINKMLEAKATGLVTGLIAKIPAYITLPVVPLALSTGIAAGPQLNSEMLTLGLAGSIVPSSKTDLPQDDIPSAASMPASLKDDQKVQLFLNEYVLNSAFNSLYYLKTAFTITHDMIPASLPITIDTATFEVFFPGIEAKFGRSAALDIEVYMAEKADAITIDKDGLSLSFATGLKFLVPQADGKDPVTAVDIQMPITGAIGLTVVDDKVQISIDKLESGDVKLISTAIDHLEADQISQMFDGLFTIVRELASALLGSGMTLPNVNGISFQDTKIALNDGYIAVETTPNFKGTEQAHADFLLELTSEVVEHVFRTLLNNPLGLF